MAGYDLVQGIQQLREKGITVAAANGSSMNGQDSPAIVGGNAHVKFLFK